MKNQYAIIFTCVCVMPSCAPVSDTQELKSIRSTQYATNIQKLFPEISKKGALSIATAAINASAKKKKEWKVTFAPLLHNTLVNIGILEKGLCYHWAQYLYQDIENQIPNDIKMYLIVSNQGKFNEHHAISLFPSQLYWTEGLLIDGWRDSGNLEFYRVADERNKWRFESKTPYLSELSTQADTKCKD